MGARRRARVGPDGSVLGRIRDGAMQKHLCFNSPGVDRHIIPDVYRKVAAEKRPAQIWIDENIITVNLCWCPHCRRVFREGCGMEAPVRAGDPGWAEFAKFHRDTFVRWQKKVHDAVQEGNPGTLVTFNHSYWLSQPETPPSFVRNLSADIHHDTQGMDVYGRYGSGIGVPFDIMPGLSVKNWAGTDPKPPEKVLTEVAVILANGGRWNIGEFPTGRRHPVAAFQDLAARGARFARDRQPWTLHARSVPVVAVLQAASTHYARVLPENASGRRSGEDYVWSTSGELVRLGAEGNPGPTRVYFYDNRAAPDEITGAAQALSESQVHFDIINEDVLVKRLAEYQLLVLPEQYRLRDDVVAAIRAFVRGGGALLATGASARSGIGDVLGVAFEGVELSGGRLDLGGCAVSAPEIFRVQAAGAEVEARFEGTDQPAVLAHRFGAGRVVYLAADIMGRYGAASPLGRRPEKGTRPPREWIGQLLGRLLPRNPLRVVAPSWYSIYLRTRGPDRLVHVVDRSFDWKGPRPAPASGVITTDLAWPERPRSVLLQPGAEAPDWQWEGGVARVHVPLEKVGIHRVIEIQ